MQRAWFSISSSSTPWPFAPHLCESLLTEYSSARWLLDFTNSQMPHFLSYCLISLLDSWWKSWKNFQQLPLHSPTWHSPCNPLYWVPCHRWQVSSFHISAALCHSRPRLWNSFSSWLLWCPKHPAALFTAWTFISTSFDGSSSFVQFAWWLAVGGGSLGPRPL